MSSDVTKWIRECRNHFSKFDGAYAKLMDQLKSLMVIGHVTKGHNPRENGLTERFNQTIIQMLRKKINSVVEWDEMLPFCVFAYNTAIDGATGESPFFCIMVFWLIAHWLIGEFGPRSANEPIHDVQSYVQEVAEVSEAARQYAREVNDRARQKMKAAYDLDRGSCKVSPKVGDCAFMKVPNEKQSSRNPKLANSWEGPYRVLECSDNSVVNTLIHGDRDAIRAPFDMLIKLPPEISDEPLRTTRSRGKRGRPRKIQLKATPPVSMVKIRCFRTLISFDHPLNMRKR
uniref:Integrase catalytic domain-containing protein n=1 Tax=Nippostrongylus brasiliensis TaxID=27835 RepID=A0A0N4YLA2_NIPBR